MPLLAPKLFILQPEENKNQLMRSKTEISYNQNQLMGGGYPIYGQPMMNGPQNGLMMG